MFASSRCTDALSAFLLCIEPIEKIVVEMTNLFGKRKYKTHWQDVDIITMRAYYGLLLLAGVYRSHDECITELWDDFNGRPVFRATMPLRKFQLITECLRFDDKEERNIRGRNKLAPIQNVFEALVHRFQVLYKPGKCVTVDEQLLPFRGRCKFIIYMPSKPGKYGIKIWMLCDSETFYVYNMQIYTGRDRNCGPEVNQGERVVLDLTEGLDGRNVTCENFFTSYSLATKLKSRKMTLVGTIRKNRNELPPILVDMKRKPVYHSEFVFEPKLRATLVSYVPKKNRFVTLLSTYHTKKEVDADDPKKPHIIHFYNHTKGAVDTVDEMVGSYRSKRKVRRWPVAVFNNMLDIAACNALVIFLSLNPTWNFSKKNYRRRIFLKEVGMGLVQPYIQRRERIPRAPHASALVNEIQNNPPEPETTNNESTSRTRRLQHTPRSNKRARCHMCPNISKANLHSVRCDKCTKTVCPIHRYVICEKCENIA